MDEFVEAKEEVAPVVLDPLAEGARNQLEGYLREHGVHDKMSTCVKKMLHSLPTDPLHFVMNHFKELMNERDQGRLVHGQWAEGQWPINIDTFVVNILPTLDTGDLILMNFGMRTKRVKSQTDGSIWTHAAIVYTRDDPVLWRHDLNDKTQKVLLAEVYPKGPGFENVLDLCAAQLRIASFIDDPEKETPMVAVRKLLLPVTDRMKDNLEMTYTEELRARVGDDVDERATPASIRVNPDDMKSYSAEFVARCLQAMGLLQDPSEGGRPSSDFVPNDFAFWKRNKLNLLAGSYGPEMVVIRKEVPPSESDESD